MHTYWSTWDVREVTLLSWKIVVFIEASSISFALTIYPNQEVKACIRCR